MLAKIMSRLIACVFTIMPSIALASDMGSAEFWFIPILIISFFSSCLFYLITGFLFSVLARRLGMKSLCKTPLVFGLITIVYLFSAGSELLVVSLALGVGLSSLAYYKVLVSGRFLSKL